MLAPAIQRGDLKYVQVKMLGKFNSVPMAWPSDECDNDIETFDTRLPGSQ